jgi:phenylacetate-CoA ligase
MYNFIAEKILAPSLDIIRGTQTMKCLESLEESQWLPRDKLLEIQNERLRKLITHAFDTVPYYRELLSERNLTPDDVMCSDDLKILPVLTKQLFRDNFNDMISQGFNRKDTLLTATGGATGEPLIFYSTREDQYNRGMARALRAFSWFGYRIGDKTIFLRNARPHKSALEKWNYSLKKFFERRIDLDTTKMSDEQMKRILHKLTTFQPLFIMGYPSALYLLARYIEKQGSPRLYIQKIIPAGEQLYDYQKKLIERIFQCETFTSYSSWEVYNIAAECEEHRGYHIAAEDVIIEIVDDEGKPVPAGVEGRVLATNLHNYAMPFIRYDIGDIGVLSDEACPCGRELPLLVSLKGRTTDIILTKSGRAISGLALLGASFMRLLASAGVEHIQVVQEHLEEITVKLVVPSEQTQENRDRLSSEVISRYENIFGDEMDIIVQFDNEIIPTPSGKRRFIVSRLPHMT